MRDSLLQYTQGFTVGCLMVLLLSPYSALPFCMTWAIVLSFWLAVGVGVYVNREADAEIAEALGLSMEDLQGFKARVNALQTLARYPVPEGLPSPTE